MFVILGLSLWLSLGCASTGVKVEESQLTLFVPGTTSYYAVVAVLGKPTSMQRQADGTRQVAYTYSQAQLKVENFLPIVGMFLQGATYETTTVILYFDAQDRYTGYEATAGSDRTGTGFMSGAKQ